MFAQGLGGDAGELVVVHNDEMCVGAERGRAEQGVDDGHLEIHGGPERGEVGVCRDAFG